TLAEYGIKHFTRTLPALVATGHNSPRTVEFYRHLWNTHVVPFLGHHRLTALTNDVLRDWQTDRAQATSTHTGKPLSARTQQAVYGVLRSVLNEAIRDGLLERNPLSATGVRAPKGERGRPSALSDATIIALLRQIVGTWLHALVVLMYLTAVRPGEALGLRWADLDLEAGTWDISRTIARVPKDDGDGTTLGFSEPKTPSSKAPVALASTAVDVLLEQRQRVEQQRHKAEGEGRPWADLDLVFATRAGSPLALGNVLRKLKLQANRAGVVEDVALHRLRHTAATVLLEEGVSVAVTSKLLRHTRLATTADIYSHMTERIATEAADTLDARLKRLHQGSDPS
ncbi:MAG: tyrosine-type recombinase/integrase, partial [Nocardioidaceae bacterium]